MIPVFLTGILCWMLHEATFRVTGQEILDPFLSPEWIARWNGSEWDLVRTVEFLTTRVFIFYSDADPLNINLWTMPVEFAFSLLIFGACAVMLGRHDIAVILVVTACFCIASWRATPIEYFLKGIDSAAFIFGMAAARYRELIVSTISRFSGLPYLMMIAGMLLSSALVDPDAHYLLALGMGLFATAIFFFGFVGLAGTRDFLSGRFFGFLGEVSFALYLLHGSVLYLVFQVGASLGDYGWGTFIICAVLSLSASLVLSLVFTRYIEMPLVSQVRRAIGSRIRERSPA
jgi:peptidoglycan/LPS O-acetylase OafA/YrhL